MQNDAPLPWRLVGRGAWLQMPLPYPDQADGFSMGGLKSAEGHLGDVQDQYVTCRCARHCRAQCDTRRSLSPRDFDRNVEG